MLDQKAAKVAGVTGLLLAVRPLQGDKGTIDITLDYSGFRHAYGGDWASRLTLHRLPQCALTTPNAKKCQSLTALKSNNDVKTATLSAAVPVAAANDDTASTLPVTEAAAETRSASALEVSDGTVLLAATAAASGASGNFKATPLAPSGSWTAGGSSGGFSWDYGVGTPVVPGGVQPKLGLSYSSQSVDGRTAATNNQANWIGDGWSMEPGYIERRYVSCSDDTTGSNGTDKSGDLC